MDGLQVLIISLLVVGIYIFLEARPKGFSLSALFKSKKD